jgi:hypothetical protein
MPIKIQDKNMFHEGCRARPWITAITVDITRVTM